MRIKTKVTFNQDAIANLPLTIDCPNKECDEKITFKLGKAENGETVDCPKCGTHVNLSTAN